MTEEKAEDWLTPAESLAILEPHFGPAARTYVADKLKEGAVRCRAEKRWESEEREMNVILKTMQDAEITVNVDIRPALWRSSRFWSADLDLWRWDLNRFVLTQSKKPVEKTILLGLTFAADDIRKLLPPEGKPKQAKGPGGAPKKLDAWTAFWHVVVGLASSEKIRPNGFPSQAALRKEILDELGDGVLSDETIKPEVRQIWKKFMRLPGEMD